MKLIADSGSSKTDWRLISDDKILKFKTQGLNPFFISQSEIENIIANEFATTNVLGVSKVVFYGAGCVGESKILTIEKALKNIFKKASTQVYSDMFGCARGLFGNEEGIAVILGTGANTCFYNGKEILNKVPSLGYILGDEGSGANLGKALVACYLRNDLPQELHDVFLKRYSLSKETVLNAVYHQPFPNRWLSSLSTFLHEHREHPYIKHLLVNCFNDFFDKQICKYYPYQDYSIRIAGSIGFYFQTILLEIAESRNVKIDKFIKSPIDDLVKFHVLYL